MSPNSCMWNPCRPGSSPVIVPLISVGVPGACINKMLPLTLSECCSSHWAITVVSPSVMLLTLLQLHSFARVRGQLVSVNSVARMSVFIHKSIHAETCQRCADLEIYANPVRISLPVTHCVVASDSQTLRIFSTAISPGIGNLTQSI